jgi:glycerol uptake facilitator protein
VALAVWGRFPWTRVGPYVLGQLAGAVAAALLLLAIYQPQLAQKERAKGLTRGQPGSELTAMCYGEYFPNPGPLAAGEGRYDPAGRPAFDSAVSEGAAFLAEVVGTLVLALVVFAVTDGRNPARPGARLEPAFIGLTVAALISVIAPLTQACLNPARDFGPRLVAAFAGWGPIAIPGPRGGFLTVYVLAPTLGAILGGGVYVGLLRPALPREEDLSTTPEASLGGEQR